MSENDQTCLPLIIYYMRETYYRHAINTAEENLKSYNNDPVLKFFKAFATLMEGNTQEASREFLQLRDHPHLSLCSTVALIHTQQTSETSRLDLDEAVAGDRALYYTALLFWILELDLGARTCVEKMLKLSESSPEVCGLILKGWMMLTSDTEEDRPQAIRYFDSGVQDTGSVFGLMGKVKKRLQALMSVAEISEPCNPSMHLEITAAISRLCGHNPEILQMLTVFVRRESSRAPAASDVFCELGYLLNHQSKYKEALKCYSTALKTDPECTSALLGTIRCQLMCDHLEEAAQHLTFFCEVQESLGNTAEVPLLKALLGRKQSAGEETVMELLKDATELHFSALRGLNYGVEYLQKLNLNFLLQITFCKQDFALTPGQTPPLWLKHSHTIMETVVRAVPGMTVSSF